jgi:F0F1-type ATP synthase assembly protein I
MAGPPNPEDPADLWRGMSTGWQISVYLLVSVCVFGGLGYLIDWLAGMPKVFTAIGMIAGAVFGIYVIYIKYGRGDGANR